MKKTYQNRELSVLSFNERVLQEAEDSKNPLMERVKFLGIFSSNMDEFFKVRVASLHRQLELGEEDKAQILELVSERARQLDKRFQSTYNKVFRALRRKGVRLHSYEEMCNTSDDVLEQLREHFNGRILPFLVPLIIDERRVFPQLDDSVPYLAVKMYGQTPRYAILKVPTSVKRFVELNDGTIVYIDDVIRYFLDDIFRIFDYEYSEAYEFKIVRDAELDMDNDFSADYVRRMEEELQQRKGGRPTRLVYDESIPPVMLQILIREMGFGKDDTLVGGSRYHNMRDLIDFPNRRPDLSFTPDPVSQHPALSRVDIPVTQAVDERDILVTYPFQSFDNVIRLLRESAIDPEVTEIKMTIYRLAKESQVVNALINAASNGKSVLVSIEIQARFDEERNIAFAERLMEAGATVVYGLPPMKVHGKLLLIKRRRKSYAGLATGNFNEATGRLYVDSVLLTADERITKEIEQIFDFLERAARIRLLTPPKFKHLLVSPFNLREKFEKLIETEKNKGKQGYILIKVNHLTDIRIVQKLRKAAEAGVQVDLIVRTTHAVPAHKNIRAISIVGRYLEHQRIYVFGRDLDQRIYLGSADWMERNFDWRLEVAFPVYAKYIRKEIMTLLENQLKDNAKARVLDDTQSNDYVKRGGRKVDAQDRAVQYFARLSGRLNKRARANKKKA